VATRPQLGAVIREELGTFLVSLVVLGASAYVLMRAAQAFDPDWLLWELGGGFLGITLGSALLLSVLWRWRL
jgi:hypothetical protein